MTFQKIKTFVTKFIRDQWFGVLAFVTGILASYYFYQASLQYRDPIFIVEPARTIILSSGNISNAPIKVIKRNGIEVKSDLTSVRFYFWNKGRESIKSENILKPLKIYLANTNAEIIDYKILKVSRDIVSPKLEHSTNGASNSLNISFAILEVEDGFAGQVVYEGDPNTKIQIDGFIEGVSQITTTDTLVKGKAIKDTVKNSLIFILALVVMMLIAIVFFIGAFLIFNSLIQRLVKKLPENEKKVRVAKYQDFALKALMALGFVAVLIFAGIQHFNTMDNVARARISDEVPLWLKR